MIRRSSVFVLGLALLGAPGLLSPCAAKPPDLPATAPGFSPWSTRLAESRRRSAWVEESCPKPGLVFSRSQSTVRWRRSNA